MKKILATTIALLLTSAAFGWDRLPDADRIGEVRLVNTVQVMTQPFEPCIKNARNKPVSVIQFRGGPNFRTDIVKIIVKAFSPETGDLDLVLDGDNRVRTLEKDAYSKPFVLLPGGGPQLCIKAVIIEGLSVGAPTEIVRVIGH